MKKTNPINGFSSSPPASRLALRLRSHLLRTATTTSFNHRPIVKSPIVILSPLSDLRKLPSDLPFAFRFLSTARRGTTRTKYVDIGARARQLHTRRLWAYALTFSCIVGFIVIVLNSFQDQLVFYVTPTDAMEKYSSNPSKNKFRLGGLVLEGSVVHPASSPEMEFVITDLMTDILQLSRFSATGRLFSSMDGSKSPLTPVLGQAKQGFSVKEDGVASPDDRLYEGPLRIVEYPDPILRAKNKRIESFDDNLKKLVGEMFDIMYKTHGIGLSAPQVGINVQLMVFNPVGKRGEGEEIVLVNPRVNTYSEEMVLFTEGCLSFPGFYAVVKRPETVKIDAQDINGARFTVNLSGVPARVFQHELDHLQGVLFFERMTDEVLDTFRTKLQALEKKYEARSGFPSPERIETRQSKKVAVGFGK